MKNFTTSENLYENGWEGKYSNLHLSAKEVAQRLREFIKKDAELSACKWSIRSGWAGYNYTLDIALMEAPFDPFSEEFRQKHPTDAENGYSQHGTCEDFTSPECQKIMRKVHGFVTQFNWDHSDGMIDYFDRHIYDKYYIGLFNKPFKRTEKMEKANPTTAKTGNNISFVDYSAKAFAIIGNTQEIKETLKNLGGKFNPRLSCGAGWIFSKKKEKEVRAFFSI